MTKIAIVVDLECDDAPMPLGKYLHTVEDVVFYRTPAGTYSSAPCDCVKVVSVDLFMEILDDLIDQGLTEMEHDTASRGAEEYDELRLRFGLDESHV